MRDWEKEVLPNVSSKYGAPMGRADLLPETDDEPVKLHLRRMRLVDYDYDAGGAYFGAPMWNHPEDRLWVAWGHCGDESGTYLVRVIVRAATRAEAKEAVLESVPCGRFYR